jgi:N12 class adenine-specific DNA methylase/2'-5' RNA ligase
MGVETPAPPENAAERIAATAGHLVGFIGGAPVKAGAAIYSATVGKLLMPLAKGSLGVRIAKFIADEAGRMATMSAVAQTGTAIEQPTPGAAVAELGKAAASGAVTGGIFGALGAAVPESAAGLLRAGKIATAKAAGETVPLAERAAGVAQQLAEPRTLARMGMGIALMKAQRWVESGKPPWTDQAWAESAYDFGLDAYFLFHGRDLRQIGNEVHHEAQNRGVTEAQVLWDRWITEARQRAGDEKFDRIREDFIKSGGNEDEADMHAAHSILHEEGDRVRAEAKARGITEEEAFRRDAIAKARDAVGEDYFKKTVSSFAKRGIAPAEAEFKAAQAILLRGTKPKGEKQPPTEAPATAPTEEVTPLRDLVEGQAEPVKPEMATGPTVADLDALDKQPAAPAEPAMPAAGKFRPSAQVQPVSPEAQATLEQVKRNEEILAAAGKPVAEPITGPPTPKEQPQKEQPQAEATKVEDFFKPPPTPQTQELIRQALSMEPEEFKKTVSVLVKRGMSQEDAEQKAAQGIAMNRPGRQSVKAGEAVRAAKSPEVEELIKNGSDAELKAEISRLNEEFLGLSYPAIERGDGDALNAVVARLHKELARRRKAAAPPPAETAAEVQPSAEKPLAEAPEEAPITGQPSEAEPQPKQQLPVEKPAPEGKPAEGQQAAAAAPEEAPKAEFEHSSTQVNLPPEIAKKVTDYGKTIPDAELAEKGREQSPHVTVRFGLHGEEPAAVEEKLAGEGPVNLKIGGVGVFKQPDYDVLYAKVDSPELARLHQKLGTLPNTNEHGEYVPHVTIAYLKPGEGDKYVGHTPEVSATVNSVQFSAKSGKTTDIPLGKRSPLVEPAAKPEKQKTLLAESGDRVKITDGPDRGKIVIVIGIEPHPTRGAELPVYKVDMTDGTTEKIPSNMTEPVKKTPQIPNEPKTGYVLPGFVGKPHAQPEVKPIAPAEEPAKPIEASLQARRGKWSDTSRQAHEEAVARGWRSVTRPELDSSNSIVYRHPEHPGQDIVIGPRGWSDFQDHKMVANDVGTGKNLGPLSGSLGRHLDAEKPTTETAPAATAPKTEAPTWTPKSTPQKRSPRGEHAANAAATFLKALDAEYEGRMPSFGGPPAGMTREALSIFRDALRGAGVKPPDNFTIVAEAKKWAEKPEMPKAPPAPAAEVAKPAAAAQAAPAETPEIPPVAEVTIPVPALMNNAGTADRFIVKYKNGKTEAWAPSGTGNGIFQKVTGGFRSESGANLRGEWYQGIDDGRIVGIEYKNAAKTQPAENKPHWDEIERIGWAMLGANMTPIRIEQVRNLIAQMENAPPRLVDLRRRLSDMIEREVAGKPAEGGGPTGATATAKPGPVSAEGEKPLEGKPSEPVQGTPEGELPGRGGGERLPERPGHVGPGTEEGASVLPGVAGGEPGVHLPAGRTGAEAEAPKPTVPAPKPDSGQPGTASHPAGRNFRITDAVAADIGTGTPRERIRGNIDAIRILKEIETAGRVATPAEQEKLVRYVGWGGLSNAFNPWNDYANSKMWRAVQAELRGLLTRDEYEAASISTQNAHYTSPTVVKAMWTALEHLGMRSGGRGLEPSMGIGHFFGLMPDSLVGTRLTGVELDPITGRIGKLLYPEAAIHVAGFETVRLPDNFYDVAFSNVPFGGAIHDPKYRRNPLILSHIHDYFFAKAVDTVRPGGVIAFISSKGTFDKRANDVRAYLSERADLLGAVRLPNTAFKGNAGTEVTTDIIFLQKRAPGQAAAGESWLNVKPLNPDEPEHKKIYVNEYFVKHPEMMLGEMTLQGSMYRSGEPTLEGPPPTQAQLEDALRRLPANSISTWQPVGEVQPTKREDQLAPEHIKDGAFTIHDGQLVSRQGSYFEPVTMQPEAASRVRGMIGIRDAARTVIRSQITDAPAAERQAARDALNKVYDAFVAQKGALNSKPNRHVFADDPDAPLLAGLEKYDEVTNVADKADIFTMDLPGLGAYKPVAHVETATEALAVSMNEMGRLDWLRMEELTGRSPQDLQTELGPEVYMDPDGNAWKPQDEYLSGNVREKLAKAEMAAANDPAFRRNVEALKSVMPPDVEPGNIGVRLGSPWVPAETVRDFIAELLEVYPYSVKLQYAEPIATWNLDLDKSVQDRVSNTTTYGTSRVWASDLIEAALNGRTITVYDTLHQALNDLQQSEEYLKATRAQQAVMETAIYPRFFDAEGNQRRSLNQDATLAAREKMEDIKARFSPWLWKDADRADLHSRIFNERHNTDVLRTVKGEHITAPGANKSILRLGDFDPHQKEAIARQLLTGNTLLAHDVGGGKTYSMIAAAMEMRRLGLAKKPVFVVPNHLAPQTADSFSALYPGSNVLLATEEDLSAGKRQRFMARVATNDWDSVIMTYTQFESLPVSDETFNKFLQKEIDDLEAAILQAHAEAKAAGGGGRRGRGKQAGPGIVKQLAKAKKNLESKLRSRANREDKDTALTFEELGIDQLFVDEADAFKNLYFTTKMGNISGLPKSESNRAFDMFIKARYTSDRNGGKRGLTFATATPISNTIAEMYTMKRFLRPDLLRQHGVEHFDAWARTFGDTITAWEVNITGSGIRQATRFARFTNWPALIKMFRSFSDVRTAAELKLERPKLKGGKETVVVVPGSLALKAYVKDLDRRSDAIKGIGYDSKGQRIRVTRPDPKDDNMLKVTSDGKKAALDMRLVQNLAGEPAQSKLRYAAERIYSQYREGADKRLTQVVFLDLSVPKKYKKGDVRRHLFNAYDDLKSKLVAKGIPEKEIKFIQSAAGPEDKQRLFDSMNSGRVRVLIGSTEKMGAGTNIQKRLIASHNLDIGWRPRDGYQRDGRILRQGNTNPTVDILHYVTEGSLDAYMRQVNEGKARFIAQGMAGGTSQWTMEDIEAAVATHAEIKALATGNPIMMEKIKVDTEVARLSRLRAAHENQQMHIGQEIRYAPGKIEAEQRNAKRLAYDFDIYKKAKAERDASGEGFSMMLQGEFFGGKGARDQADTALSKLATKQANESDRINAGFSNDVGSLLGFRVRIETDSRGSITTYLVLGENKHYAHNFTTRVLENVLSGLEGQEAASRGRVSEYEKRLTDLKKEAGKPFDKERELAATIERQQQIIDQLDLNKTDHQAADTDPDVEIKDPDAEDPDAEATDTDTTPPNDPPAGPGGKPTSKKSRQPDPLEGGGDAANDATKENQRLLQQQREAEAQVKEVTGGGFVPGGMQVTGGLKPSGAKIVTGGGAGTPPTPPPTAPPTGPEGMSPEERMRAATGRYNVRAVGSLGQILSDRIKGVVESVTGAVTHPIATVQGSATWQKFRRATVFEWDLRGMPIEQDEFRVFEAAKRHARELAEKDVRGVVEFMGLKNRSHAENIADLDHFTEIILLRNYKQILLRPERYPNGVPFGLTLPEVEARLAEIDTGQQMATVQNALDAHQRLQSGEKQDLYQREQLDPDTDLPDYFPHFVEQRTELEVGGHVEGGKATIPLPGAGKRIRNPFRHYLQRAEGSSKGITTDYIQAMFRHRYEVRFTNSVDDFAKGILDRRDKLKLLPKEVRDGLEPGDVVNMEQYGMAPGTVLYQVFQYTPGRTIYRTDAIIDGALERAIASGESFLASPGDAKRISVLGQYYRRYLIPQPLAARFENFAPAMQSDLLSLLQNSQGPWKRMTIGYWGQGGHVTNLVGDAANMGRLAIELSTDLSEIKRGEVFRLAWANILAIKDIVDWSRGTPNALVDIMSKYDVLESGMVGSQISGGPQAPQINAFRSYAAIMLEMALDRAKGVAAGAGFGFARGGTVGGIAGGVVGGTIGYERYMYKLPRAREAGLRAGMMRYQMGRLARGLPVRDGAVDLREMEHMERGAAKVARESLVDANKLTPDEKRLFRGFLMPFYSWPRGNAAAWTRFMSRLAVAPLAYLGLRLMAEAWNNSDDEKRHVEWALPPWKRQSFHFNTSFFHSDGRMHVLYLPGDPFIDWLAAIGFGNTMHNFADFLSGRKTAHIVEGHVKPVEMYLSDVIKKQLHDSLTAIPRKGISLLTPLIKGPVEATTGQSLLTGAPIVPRHLRGTDDEFWRQVRHAVETAYRPAREARLLAEEAGKHEPENLLRSRFGLGLGQIYPEPVKVKEAELGERVRIRSEAMGMNRQQALNDLRRDQKYLAAGPIEREAREQRAIIKADRWFNSAWPSMHPQAQRLIEKMRK